MKILKDSKAKIETMVDETTGFLTAPVTLARVGVQHYYGFELGLTDRIHEKIGVFRPPIEVFDQSSIDSFVNLVLTDDHPSTPVTTENVDGLQIGMVSGVESQKDSGVLKGVLTITNKNVISKLDGGKMEVSVGYSNDLKEEKGEYNGVSYDFVQTNIKANHLAIVDAGRCGSACKITLDNKESQLEKITIDGIEFEVDSPQLVQAIRKQQDAFGAEKEKLKKEKEEADEEKEEMKKEKDKAEAAKDSLIADSAKFSDEAINQLVTDKALLLESARKILGKDGMPDCTNCDKEIKAAVIDNINGLDVSGKSDEYINAAYDSALLQYSKAKDSLGNLQKDFQKDKEITDRESSQRKYVSDHLNGGK